MAFDLDAEKTVATEAAPLEEAVVGVEAQAQGDLVVAEDEPQVEQEREVEPEPEVEPSQEIVEDETGTSDPLQDELEASANEPEPQVEQALAPAAQEVQKIGPELVKDQITKQLERLLSEDVKEIYKGLPDHLKVSFGAKGEETARKIKLMFDTGKVQTDKISEMIKEWLVLLPDVGSQMNPFYKKMLESMTKDVVAYWDKERVAPVDANQI